MTRKKNGRQLAPPAVPMHPVIYLWVLPASAVTTSAMISVATVEAAIPMEAAVAAEPRVTVKPFVAAPESLISMESALRPAEVAVPAKAPGPPIAVESRGPVKVSIVVEVVESISTTIRRAAVEISAAKIPAIAAPEASPAVASMEIPLIVASKTAPSAIAIPKIAPPVSAAVIPPPVMVVEVNPCRVVEREKSSAIECRAVKPVEPRSRADKHSAHKPLRPVISIRRAGIRRIRVVAVYANRCRSDVRWPQVSRTHSHANRHAHVGARRPRRRSCKRDHQTYDRGVL